MDQCTLIIFRVMMKIFINKNSLKFFLLNIYYLKTAYKRMVFKLSNLKNVDAVLFSDADFNADCSKSNIYDLCKNTGTVCACIFR